jgi:hypothetical protein
VHDVELGTRPISCGPVDARRTPAAPSSSIRSAAASPVPILRPRAQRDRGPGSTLHVRGRDDQPGIDRENTNPEQPRDDRGFNEKPFRERPAVVGNRDQVRRR